MPQREGPRREVLRHIEAELRLKTSILQNKPYPGKSEDLALCRRKYRELGPERYRRVLQGGGI